MRWPDSEEERFSKKYEPEPNTGCWLWAGILYWNGYGGFYFRGRRELAHRAAYLMFRGPIPVGLELDHLCRVRPCVNPAHLEPVTRRENLRRGDTNAAVLACPAGHPYDEQNTWRDKNGHRHCRICQRASCRAHHRRRRQRLRELRSA